MPLALGGLEVPPLTFYQVVEAVARLDGSTGWCTFIGGATASWGPIWPRKPRKTCLGVIPVWSARWLPQAAPRS